MIGFLYLRVIWELKGHNIYVNDIKICICERNSYHSITTTTKKKKKNALNT